MPTDSAATSDEQPFRALVEHSSDGIVLIDLQGAIRYANPATRELLGYAPEELAGRSLFALIDPDDLPLIGQRFAEILTRPGATMSAEFRVRHPDGDVRWLEGTGTNLLAVPAVQAIVANVRDITRRKRAEASLHYLSSASTLLGASLDYHQTLEQVARLTVPFLADWCTVHVRLPDGRLERVAAAHVDPVKQELLRRLPGDPWLAQAANPIRRVVQTGTGYLTVEVRPEHLTRSAQDAAHQALFDALGPRSVIVVPLIAREQTLGALVCVYAESERRYSETDLELLQDLAGRAAVAVDNAHLHHESELERRRVDSLSEATARFAEMGLDLTALLQLVTEQAARMIGDGCMIRLLTEDGRLVAPAASYHPNAEALALARELMADADATRADDPSGMVRVVRTGEPLLLSLVDPELDRSVIRPEYWPYLERYPVHSLLIVPLRLRDHLLGTVTIWRDQNSQPLTIDDQTLLTQLADRAALAIDNARLYQAAQQALRYRDEFLSIASHELKTPLTTLKGYAQLLRRVLERQPEDAARLTRVVDELQQQMERFELLVTDLLDVSRIEQGHLELRPEPVELSELARRVLARFAQEGLVPSGHRLALDVPEPIVGRWDAERLDQVLTNLISNAVKYSPGGGEVRVSLRERDGQAEVTVTDQGIGIPEQELSELFKPFMRGAAARLFPGTGLGLYISRNLVELHGGTIEAASRLGQGSRFTVRLPLRGSATAE
ncbi:MAG TPA: ATP-binding protein [Thermomicrobiaceae bacterium]|nr:ATP-binding protein [Thermomicrobiaceae bacterium]